MKIKILTGLLIVSMLLNAAGIFFFVAYLVTQGRYKSAKRDRDNMARNITAMVTHQTIPESPDSNGVFKRYFISHYDGFKDDYLIRPPYQDSLKSYTLVVYLHGMGSNNLEPFVAPHATTVANTVCQLDPSFMLLSCNYRKDASWGSKPAMSDITQNIRAVCQEYPVGRIILVGTSMGGCTVLTYAATAPEDIKGKIAGIVSVESAGDLIKLHDQTDNSTVRLTLEAMMGGSPEFAKANYEERSFLPNISGLPKSVKVAVISAKEDNIVPPSLQRDVVSSLEKQGNAVKLIEVDDSHGVPESKFYQEGMQFVIQ